MPLDASEVPLNVYQGHLHQGRLAYQYSLAANRPVFPPRLVCPFSGGGIDQLEWRISQGLGTVYSSTVLSPKEGTPYCVALIDLDEGFRMMSQIRHDAQREPRIGDRVRVRMGKLSEAGETLPLFDREDSRDA